MNDSERKLVNEIADDLAKFVEHEYSRRFRDLSAKEDRHLFFFAQIITRLKNIEQQVEEDLSFGKVIPFCAYKNKKDTSIRPRT